MKLPLRQVLAETNIAAVAILLFLLWSLDLGVQFSVAPILRAIEFMVNTIAIQRIPFGTFSLGPLDRMALSVEGWLLFNIFVNLLAARLLSGWVYRAGPFRSLMTAAAALKADNYA